MSHPFDLMCKKHPDRPAVVWERKRMVCAECYEFCPNHPDRRVVDSGVCTKRFCAECIEQHQQTWANRSGDIFAIRYQDERAPDGRSIYADHQGYYRPIMNEGFDKNE